MHLKVSSAKGRPFCLGLNVLKPVLSISFWSLCIPVATFQVSSLFLYSLQLRWHHMMTSSNGNIFHVTDPLWGESIGDRWNPTVSNLFGNGSCSFPNIDHLPSLSNQYLVNINWTQEWPTIWIQSDLFLRRKFIFHFHYTDVIMSMMVPQITSIFIVYSTTCSGVDQRKHQSSVSLAFVRGIHRSPVNSPHKGPVMQKMFPFDDAIMSNLA